MVSSLSAGRDAAGSRPVIVGAGPAGLAVAACLKQAGIDSTLLEQGDSVAAAWHGHYDRLHLNTDKGHSALPHVPFPGHYPRYPSRRQVIDYLEDYARRFQLKPEFGQEVIAAHPINGGWEVHTRQKRYAASHLVVAAGYTRVPHVPDWPGRASYRGVIVHSAQYRNGEPFRGRRVLVVGLGNSGGEIAVDLFEHGARPALSVRGPVNVIPRDLLGIPILSLAIAESRLPPRLADALNAPVLRAVVGDLRRYGLRRAPYGPVTAMRRHGRVPLIDTGVVGLIRQSKVAVHPGIEHFVEDGAVFIDGCRRAFDTIVLATGYRPKVNAFLEGADAALDGHGTPLSSGVETPVPGLYFCGYRVSPTGILREIGIEAERIGAANARRRAR